MRILFLLALLFVAVIVSPLSGHQLVLGQKGLIAHEAQMLTPSHREEGISEHLTITYRKATLSDLKTLVHLLLEDELGKTREESSIELDRRYIDAFHKIDTDPNHYLMVVENSCEIIGTCHLTMMPSLTFTGQTRMQIEGVRVMEKYRGQKIGKWMINAAIEHGKQKGASILQLTTNKKRLRAKLFYEELGFEASHEGMKMYVEKK